MDRLATIEAFVKVSETQSFSEAARRLRSSKWVVSRQIAALEGELGARLFHRTTRSLTLTEAGRSYFERASRILADLQDANRSVTQLQVAPRGQLRVNAPMSFGLLHLATALPDFLARYPEVQVDMTLNDRLVDLVDEGFDVAVRIGSLEDSSLIALKLARMRRVVCASPAYLMARGVPAVPSDLKAHDCLCYSNVALSREWRFITEEGRPWPVEVRGPLVRQQRRCSQSRGIERVGLGHFADLHGRQRSKDRYASFSSLSNSVAQYATVNAVYPHSRHLSPKVRAFVDFLADRFGQQPYWDLVSAL